MVKLIIRTSLVFVVAIMLVTVARSQVDPNKRLLVVNEKYEASADTSGYTVRNEGDTSLRNSIEPRDGYSNGESAAPYSDIRSIITRPVITPQAVIGSLIFEGGAPDGINGNEMTKWAQAEDFVLGSTTTVNSVRFWTGEDPGGVWDGVCNYAFYTDSAGAPGALLDAASVTLTRTFTGNIVAGFLDEWENEFDLITPLVLTAGTTYWLTLHMSVDCVTADGIFWETTSAGFGLIGVEDSQCAGGPWLSNGHQHAFQLFGINTKFSQPPDGEGEDIPSNIDWGDMIPNVVVADDFESDGRHISAVRWWGSDLDGEVVDPKACNEPHMCGVTLGTQCGGNPDCLCAVGGDGLGDCIFLPTANCANICPNGDSDCAPGFKCDGGQNCCNGGAPGLNICLENCPGLPPLNSEREEIGPEALTFIGLTAEEWIAQEQITHERSTQQQNIQKQFTQGEVMQVLMDPTPAPSGGSGVEAEFTAKARWTEVDDFVAGRSAGIGSALPPQPLFQSDPYYSADEVPDVLTPAPTISFNGVINSPATSIPPDTHIAVGPGLLADGRVIMVTNGHAEIWNKNGSVIASPLLIDTMFSANVFDPKVHFDEHSGRFFIVVLEKTTSPLSVIHMAVSSSGTPNNLTTDWTFLSGGALTTLGGVTTWADYPGIGADSDSLFITVNQFDFTTGCNGGPCFRGTKIRVFNKASLIAGAYSFVDINYDFALSPQVVTTMPAHTYGTTTNGGFYLISRHNSSLYRLIHITGDPAVPVATTALFSWSGGLFPSDTGADQCTVSLPDLATLSSRVMNAIYRGGHLWLTYTANPDNDGQTEVVWQDITPNSWPTAGTPSVFQSGFINGIGVNPWTYMPSINVNVAGDAAITYTQSSTTECPSMYYVSRLSTATLGTFEAPFLAKLGPGFYDSSFSTSSVDRWGDYSATVVDPTDDCFWVANEFAWSSAVGNSEWATFIAGFCATGGGGPFCGDNIVNTGGETCDGTDLGVLGCTSCRAPADPNPCTCCGDGIIDTASGEQCDGTNDAACPGQCTSNCQCPPVPPGACLLVNNDFETGTFSGWTQTTTGNGGWVINDGILIPASGDGPLAPCGGSFGALANSTGPGIRTLYQDVTVPGTASTATLNWSHMIRNFAGGGVFVDPTQEFRVEIWNPANNNVLASLFSTNPGDVALQNCTQHSVDISAFIGQNIRVAFTEEDSIFFFNVHVDDVCVVTTTAGTKSIAICGAPNNPSWNNDVQAKLLATGQFGSVSIINVNTTTPTLATLQTFDAVLVYSDRPYANATALGNVMADYVDSGGGVVTAMFDHTLTLEMQGRWASQGYFSIPRVGQFGGTAGLGTVFDPSHPIMQGVATFNGGTSSYRPATTSISAGSTRIADWSDGRPLVVTKTISGVRRVDLGFYPPSSDARGDFWQTSSDGALLMANALTWVNGVQSVDPDGWFISFHEPLIEVADQLEPLALYFCDTDVVLQEDTAIPACDTHPVIEYFVNLPDCCLVHANIDSRTGLIPALKEAFFEEACLEYAIDIQAVVGHKYFQDPETLECIEVATGVSTDNDFWGWHTTNIENGTLPALQTSVKMGADGEWFYGPWDPVMPNCSPPNMAYELLTPLSQPDKPIDPLLPDPDSPGGSACGTGPNYGLACSVCASGSRVGELCTDDDDCKDPIGTPHLCVPDDTLCGAGFICGTNLAGDTINNPWPKNRYIGFLPPSSPGWLGQQIAIRVTLVSVPANPLCNGEVRWVGSPAEFSESTGSVFKFQAAPLVAAPVYTDWSAIGLPIQVYGEEITPTALYAIQALNIKCAASILDPSAYSTPALMVQTATWGDVIKPLGALGATGQPNIDDVLALVGKWLSQLLPLKAISQLQPAVLTPAVDLTVDDVLIGVNAWLGSPYPYTVSTCP